MVSLSTHHSIVEVPADNLYSDRSSSAAVYHLTLALPLASAAHPRDVPYMGRRTACSACCIIGGVKDRTTPLGLGKLHHSEVRSPYALPLTGQACSSAEPTVVSISARLDGHTSHAPSQVDSPIQETIPQTRGHRSLIHNLGLLDILQREPLAPSWSSRSSRDRPSQTSPGHCSWSPLSSSLYWPTSTLKRRFLPSLFPYSP